MARKLLLSSVLGAALVATLAGVALATPSHSTTAAEHVTPVTAAVSFQTANGARTDTVAAVATDLRTIDPAALTAVGTAPKVSTDGVGLEEVFHRYGERVSQWQNMGDLLTYVNYKVNLFWGQAFQNAGYRAPTVSIALPLPGQHIRTGCNTVTDDNAAYYCQLDDTIYFSQKMAIDIYNGVYVGPLGQKLSTGVRDFSVAYVMAHEYGHNLQREIGVDEAKIGSRAFEQQADCFAGMWIAGANAWGLLDGGDINEALATAWLVGDTGRGDDGDHGTPAQRQAAVTLGITAGAKGCMSYSN